jgi:hypothetical protein
MEDASMLMFKVHNLSSLMEEFSLRELKHPQKRKCKILVIAISLPTCTPPNLLAKRNNLIKQTEKIL